MNWINFKNRQPIDGQKVLVYTESHEMFYCEYKDIHEQGEIPWVIIVHQCNGCCEDNLIYKTEILYWTSPDKPEVE